MRRSLLSILPDLPVVHILDIGAMSLDGITPDYQSLLDAGKARLTGFEPNKEECRNLNETAGDNTCFLPYCLGDGQTATYHHYRYAPVNSLYQANSALYNQFSAYIGLADPISSEEVQTHRLDDLDLPAPVDLIEIDVQGAELDILCHGKKCLSEALIIKAEVSYLPFYQGQPLNHDIDRFMRDQGFQFFCFALRGMHALAPFKTDKDGGDGYNQLIYTDNLYIPDATRLAGLTDEQLLKLALIANDVMDAPGLSHHALALYDRRHETGHAKRFTDLFGMDFT